MDAFHVGLLVSAFVLGISYEWVHAMKLSTKSRYGVRAVLEIARNYQKGPIKRRDIAQRQEISDAYLENILLVLRNTGIIETTRGANGGYVLARPPEKITILEIVDSLEGSIAPVECVEDPDGCRKSCSCAARNVWRKLHEARVKILGEMHLSDLLNDAKACETAEYVI